MPINLLSILIYFLSYTFPSSLYSVKRYDPPGKLAKLFSNSLSSSRRSSIILSPRERISDLEDTNKNAVQSLLRKSRSSITCALLKAQCAREPPVDEEKKNLKPNDPKGGESKRGSLMSIQSNSTCSTDISRACSKETYDDWLVSDELLDILSGMFMTKFLFLRHPYDYILPPLAFLFTFISFFFRCSSSFSSSLHLVFTYFSSSFFCCLFLLRSFPFELKKTIY